MLLITNAGKREVSLLEKTIQEKNGEIRELAQKLSDMERDKHTEMVKLRLEVSAWCKTSHFTIMAPWSEWHTRVVERGLEVKVY